MPRIFKVYLYQIVMLLVVLSGSGNSTASTPEPMAKNISRLAEVRAVLTYCARYHGEESSRWLKFTWLQNEIDSVVNDVAEFHQDDAVYVSYYLIHSKLSEEASLMAELLEQYPDCKGHLLDDMTAYVAEWEDKWRDFKSAR